MPQTFARLFEKLVAFYDDTGQPRTTPETERDTLIPIRTRRAIESRFSSGKRCRKESFDSESVVDRAWFPAAATKADLDLTPQSSGISANLISITRVDRQPSVRSGGDGPRIANRRFAPVNERAIANRRFEPVGDRAEDRQPPVRARR
jgi:hypothetical protein